MITMMAYLAGLSDGIILKVSIAQWQSILLRVHIRTSFESSHLYLNLFKYVSRYLKEKSKNMPYCPTGPTMKKSTSTRVYV